MFCKVWDIIFWFTYFSVSLFELLIISFGIALFNFLWAWLWLADWGLLYNTFFSVLNLELYTCMLFLVGVGFTELAPKDSAYKLEFLSSITSYYFVTLAVRPNLFIIGPEICYFILVGLRDFCGEVILSLLFFWGVSWYYY